VGKKNPITQCNFGGQTTLALPLWKALGSRLCSPALSDSLPLSIAKLFHKELLFPITKSNFNGKTKKSKSE